jgi:hypothetical protein
MIIISFKIVSIALLADSSVLTYVTVYVTTTTAFKTKTAHVFEFVLNTFTKHIFQGLLLFHCFLRFYGEAVAAYFSTTIIRSLAMMANPKLNRLTSRILRYISFITDTFHHVIHMFITHIAIYTIKLFSYTVKCLLLQVSAGILLIH